MMMTITSFESIPYARAAAAARACSPTAARRVAFDLLFREHEGALRAFARRLCGSQTDANDLVQDALERALRAFETFAPGTNERAWLFTILHHAFIDRCRRAATERRGASIDDFELAAPEPTAPPAWAGISPEQLDEAVAALQDEFRAVYQLHAAESLSYQEIAERLGIPASTVGTRLNRARRKLRSLLQQAAMADDDA